MGKKRAGEEAYRPPAAPDAPGKTPTGLSQVAIVAIVGYVMLAASVLVQLGTQHVVPIHASPEDFEAMRETGELREELLPLLWGRNGFKPDEHAVVLTTLAAAGVVFLPTHSAHGRKWMVPSRLPPALTFATVHWHVFAVCFAVVSCSVFLCEGVLACPLGVTELCEPVSVDIIYLHPSSRQCRHHTSIGHAWLLRCSAVAQLRQCTGARVGSALLIGGNRIPLIASPSLTSRAPCGAVFV